MSKHIVVYGCMRSATGWLSKMFARNVDSDELDLNVDHEGFRKAPLVRMINHWGREGIHIEVGFDGVMIEYLHERFPDLQVAVIVRDPIDQLLSFYSTRYQPNGGLSDTGAFLTGIWHWGAIEAVLATAKAVGIDVKVWHLSYYTTFNGFKELAESLGLALRSDAELLPPWNTSNRRNGPCIEEFTPSVIEAVKQMHARLPLLSAGYAEAKAYAESKL